MNAGEYEYFPLFFADLQAAGRTTLMNAEVAKWAEYHDHPIYRKDVQAAAVMMARLTVPGSHGVCRPNLERQRTYLGALLPGYHELQGFEPVMEHPFSSFLKNRAFQDLTRETTPCCMRAEDRQTAHYGLRHYDPFLDHELIEFMFRIPGEMKIRGGVTKYLLRQAMRGILPEQTRTRIKKTGWNAPAHMWFMGKGLDAIRDLLASRRFRERGMYDVRFVERIVDEHDEIVSSGAMSDWGEVDAAMAALRNSPVTLMQCTSAYPCPPERVGLNVMLAMGERYHVPVGFSDHTLGSAAAVAAVALGAVTVEKHFAFSRLMYGSDAKHSMEPGEFRRFCADLREAALIMANPVAKDDLRPFADMKRIFEKSIVTAFGLKRGTRLAREHLAFKKPGDGIPASRYPELLGRVLKQDLPADFKIRFEDIE